MSGDTHEWMSAHIAIGGRISPERVAELYRQDRLNSETMMERIRDAYQLIESAPPRRTEPIKLTEQQIAAIRAQQPEKSPLDLGVVAPLFGVPIEKVDTVEESTPYLEAQA